ncbi:MAG: anti-sigma factor antagonist [Ilumatobacteraceae bacterium]|jgi:anti-anti-sigma factor
MHTNVLRIDVSYIDGRAVVIVQGEIDMETAPTLRVALDQLEPHQSVYLDMANVRFIDSSGIKVLVSQTLRIRKAGGALHIRNPSRVVHRIVTIAGLSEHFFEPDDATPPQAIAV